MGGGVVDGHFWLTGAVYEDIPFYDIKHIIA